MKKRLFTGLFAIFCTLALALAVSAGGHSETVAAPDYKPSASITADKPEGYPVAVYAGGCFWCVESEFRRIDGVLYTRSGYAGGTEENPTYEQVSAHRTTHREAVEVTYDPKKISYRDLTDFFMTKAHDPTQEDGQGPDIGFQYTSAIFPMTKDEESTATELIAGYVKNQTFKKPVATQVVPFTNFYPAEDYHQQYYEKYQAKTGQPHMNIWLKQQKENARAIFSGE